MNRRGFLGGLLALGAAPAIIRTPGLLMPIRPRRLASGGYYRVIDLISDGPIRGILVGEQVPIIYSWMRWDAGLGYQYGTLDKMPEPLGHAVQIAG